VFNLINKILFTFTMKFLSHLWKTHEEINIPAVSISHFKHLNMNQKTWKKGDRRNGGVGERTHHRLTMY
jgi:hypothetical protein